MECKHNQRCRYTHGFFCENCSTFFDKASATYRSGELLSSIWMVLHNISVGSRRAGGGDDAEVAAMLEKIGIGKSHENHEELIAEAEEIMEKYGVDSDSAMMRL